MKDLDIWIEPTAENAACVVRALATMSIFLSPEEVDRLAKPKLQIPLKWLYTELLTSCDDLEFSEAMARSVTASEGGIPCHVISRQDLISYKRRLSREHDLDDVDNLEKQDK